MTTEAVLNRGRAALQSMEDLTAAEAIMALQYALYTVSAMLADSWDVPADVMKEELIAAMHTCPAWEHSSDDLAEVSGVYLTPADVIRRGSLKGAPSS